MLSEASIQGLSGYQNANFAIFEPSKMLTLSEKNEAYVMLSSMKGTWGKAGLYLSCFVFI